MIKNPPNQEQAVRDLQNAVSDYLVPRAQEVCEKYGIDSSKFGINLTLPQVFAQQLIERIALGRNSPTVDDSVWSQRVFYAANTTAMARAAGLRFAQPGRMTVAVTVAVIVGAMAAGQAGLKWYWGKRIIDSVRAAELPPQVVEQLVSDTLTEMNTLMDKRASAVERFVT